MKVSVGAVIALVASVASAAAQRVPVDTNPTADELRNIITFQVDNDFFNPIGRSDRDYTNGLRLGWLSPALPDLPNGIAALTNLPTFFGEDPVTSVTRRIGVSIGQNIYTPQNTDSYAPIFNDRPYAGWLWAALSLQETYKRPDPSHPGLETPVRLDTIQFEVGIVGPAAGGEPVQNNFHTLIGDPRSNGWGNQLYNEPTLGLTLERRWREGARLLFDDPKLEWDFIPAIGASVGNVKTYARAGGMFRIGKELQADFGPGRSQPALPGSEGFISQGFGWYVFAGAHGEAVARDIFLDGNTAGNDIVHVTHRPFVGELQAGVAFLYNGVRIALTDILRTPDFFERDRWDQFGSINVTFRY
jgi:lipid A 3-O-deacylase